ncbi:glycosyltransferase family 4 protein [Terricaulis sp.]|uniref:glycosyltransferase family 4 protein n=1 Tax=Terricaulis sp. TaxID=2768686 RepID=UPI003784DC52
MLSGDFTLVGHPFAPIGMGEHVRSSWRAFAAMGVRPAICDVYGMSERDDPDFERAFGPVATREISQRLNIFHINGDEVTNSLAHMRAASAFEQAYNVIYPAWELSQYPREWAQLLDQFDEIWAPSAFIRDSIAGSARKPVFHMPLAVDVRMSSFMTRRMLNLPESAFIYLFFFDFSSYWQRKNPFAVLEAFEALAQRHPKAPLHLVLKHKGGKGTSDVVERLRAAIARRPGQIQIIDRTMRDNEVKNLVRASDCFISLHRSEGFGRGLAEAMALGVPALGTGYSGNLDFMNAENSWLVDYDLVPVGKNEYPHGAGQHWADPKLATAVAMMEQIWLDHATARKKADKARRDLACHFSPRAIGLRYIERLEQVEPPQPARREAAAP